MLLTYSMDLQLTGVVPLVVAGPAEHQEELSSWALPRVSFPAVYTGMAVDSSHLWIPLLDSGGVSLL